MQEKVNKEKNMQNKSVSQETVQEFKNTNQTIDAFERQRRLAAWEKTLANFSLEGIYPTEDMKRIGFMYINGEISFEQRCEMMKSSILAGK